MTTFETFEKLHLNKPQNVWNTVLWTSTPKWRCLNMTHRSMSGKNHSPARWWRGDDLALFLSYGPGHLCVTQSTMKSFGQKYSGVKCEAICLTAKAQDWNWVINRSMIPNAAADLRQNVWKRKESVLLWSTQSSDLSLIEMLWRDLKRAVYKLICKPQWTAAKL